MRRKWALFLSIPVLLAIFLYGQNNWMGVTRLDIVSERLPDKFDGYTILQVSDLHSKTFGGGQSGLTRRIAEAEPDMIVITGDLVDGRHYDREASLNLIRKAVDFAPVYYVTGNHEWWSGKFGELEGGIREAGAVILRNEARRITIGGQSIYLAGPVFPEAYSRNRCRFRTHPCILFRIPGTKA